MHLFGLTNVAMHLVTVGEKFTLHAAKIRKIFAVTQLVLDQRSFWRDTNERTDVSPTVL
jgi:hypothetical protein